MIWTLILLGVVIVIFSAYTRNVQETTLAIGKKLAAENHIKPTRKLRLLVYFFTFCAFHFVG
jgi:hypothetical protein